MQLGRYHVSTLKPTAVHSINFSQGERLFAIAYEGGYEVWRTFPLGLVRRRVLNGTLERAVLLPHSPLLLLQGGGNSPLYPPNKAVIYHDGIGKAVAELEFGERIRGVAVRKSTICIVLSRRTMAFTYGANGYNSGKGKSREVDRGFRIDKVGEWETAPNELGLVALSTSPSASLLALPGRQIGHVQLIHLPHTSSSRSAPFRSPIILAHTHPLSSMSCAPDGTELITTSERGTLLRVWDTVRGSLMRELRRGVDRAEMWGVGFDAPSTTSSGSGSSSSTRRDAEGVGAGEASRQGMIVGWSDKGTIHVWVTSPPKESKPNPSLAKLLSRNLPLPRYFSSTASIAQYHLPRKNPHAFSSAIGAAVDAAGVPSAKLAAEEQDDELAERFVVGWVDVEVSVGSDTDVPPLGAGAGELAQGGTDPRIRDGTGKTKPKRRSFGSDATSGTVTPALSRHSNSTVIGNGSGHGNGNGNDRISISVREHGRSSSTSASTSSPRPPTSRLRSAVAKSSDDLGVAERHIERQLVAITYSGDWYRLRIPDRSREKEDEDGEGNVSRTKKCELVEYRRLRVGGGGW